VTLASDAFIHIDQLQVRHAGAPQPAVRGVSLKVRRGELLALLGPSGCGKSTLLRAVAGLQAVQAGHVWVAGQDLTHTPAHLRPVSLVFQSYALFPHLGVLDNVAYGLRAQGVSVPAAVQRARATLALVGLEDLAARNVAEISGGQQQRVALARALVLEPQVLLLDEPLSNLHEALRRQVRSDIHQLQQRLRLTVLYVTHDQSEAMAVADRLVLMHAGVVVQQGTARQLYESPNNAFVAGFMGDARVFDLRRDTTGAVSPVRRLTRASPLCAPTLGTSARPARGTCRRACNAAPTWAVWWSTFLPPKWVTSGSWPRGTHAAWKTVRPPASAWAQPVWWCWPLDD
jgi:iron(III) transport system ATP-binding protein